ncbi:MAG: hypothetical protein N4A33_01485 [Bacteriovoracaceae bacterium]|jgi:hypothetical protein|nr:hypothetical protein [Bacteriovoracaceae bacterium]
MVIIRSVILFIFFIPFSYSFTGFAFQSHHHDGVAQFAILKKKESYTIITNTDTFSFFKKKILGKVELKLSGDQIKKMEKINSFFEAIQKTDMKLTTYKSSFNKMYKIKPHEAYIKIKQFKIPSSHVYYKEIKQIIKDITSKADLKLIDTVLVENKKFIYFKDNKNISNKPIDINFYCKRAQNNYSCFERKYGTFSL